MARITEIYKEYQITKPLAEHQLRVAAVAKQICENLVQVAVDTESVIKACLIHDMGNILKFDFAADPKLFEPEGVEHWKRVREEIVKKYNTEDEHEASLKIAKELRSSEKVLKCIASIGFSSAKKNAESSDMEAKICDVSDLRVTPHGIVSVKKRLEEGKQRYKNRPDYWISDEHWDELTNACFEIESQVFKNCKISPDAITNGSTKPIVEALKLYEM